MGADISEEAASSPAVTARRIEMTDGEFAPGCEVIGFAGKGKGLKVLREYAQGETRDETMEEKLQLGEVFDEVAEDTLFYGADGGVTLPAARP